jgi:protein-disulfide isomerase
MQITRRSILSLVGAASFAPAFAGAALADNTDPNSPFGQRSLGSPKAPVKAIEYFSLTCTHCAHFANVTMPQVEPNLITPGKLEIIYKDFPLDQVALMAAQVARSLPPERYEPFCAALFASQDRWAFARGVNSKEELAKMAALAGLARPAFDAAVGDDGLKAAILAVQDQGDKFYHVDSTPSFIFNGPAEKDHREAGERTYDEFAKLVSAAAG